MKLNTGSSGNTAVTLEMPKEAVEKLLRDYAENPEAVKDYFSQFGFEVIEIKSAEKLDNRAN